MCWSSMYRPSHDMSLDALHDWIHSLEGHAALAGAAVGVGRVGGGVRWRRRDYR